ncbi:MAG: D-Ala-D-Ala carboxypeptidase family metallohydrolase [Phormidesmis sp.]
MKLILTTDTHLKCMPVQPDEIERLGGLVPVTAGTLEIAAQVFCTGAPGTADDHYYVRLTHAPAEGVTELGWFVAAGHVKLEGTEPSNEPQEEPAPVLARSELDYGPSIPIPGISRPVGIFEPIYFEPEHSHFTWAEFTKNGDRIPVDATITMRIVKLAKYMDEVRAFLGDRPIRVTSGYRDPKSNRYVGGARDSRHMYGDAVDFWVEGLDVVDVFYQLKGYHTHGGLAVGNGFVHLDLRPGAPARWMYPGGPMVDLW